MSLLPCLASDSSITDPAGGPEQEAQRQQELESLQIAIARLPADQRLLLRLRFQEGLTLRKIAQLKYHGDTNATWRGVEAAVDALFQRLQVERSAQQRKN